MQRATSPTPHTRNLTLALVCGLSFPIALLTDSPTHTNQAHAQARATPHNAQTRRTPTRRRRTRSRKRLKRTNRPYARLAVLSPGGCFDPSPACPQGSRVEGPNFGSFDSSLGYRWRNIALEARALINSYSTPLPPKDDGRKPEGTFGLIALTTKYMPITGRNRFDPFVTLGLGFGGGGISDLESSQKVGGATAILGAGLDYFVASRFTIGLEYDVLLSPIDSEYNDLASFWMTRLNFTLYLGGSDRGRNRSRRPRTKQPRPRTSPPQPPRNPEPYRPPRRKPTR